MINTAPTASHSVRGREKLIWYDTITFLNHLCHCGALYKELLAPADKLGSTPGDTVSCFFVPFFFFFFFNCLVSFFWHYFSFWPFIPYSYMLVMHLDQCWHFKPKFGVLFWKRDFKSSWSAYWPSVRAMLLNIMTNNTQYTTNCTNVHPTPTSDQLGKAELAFCASS